MCRLLGVKKTRTTSFNPKSDGLVEQLIKTIGTLITSYMSENQHTWHENLSVLMMTYQATPHESTGLTPNELMLGRQVSILVDVHVEAPPDHTLENELQYVENLRVRLENAYDLARENLGTSAEVNAAVMI